MSTYSTEEMTYFIIFDGHKLILWVYSRMKTTMVLCSSKSEENSISLPSQSRTLRAPAALSWSSVRILLGSIIALGTNEYPAKMSHVRPPWYSSSHGSVWERNGGQRAPSFHIRFPSSSRPMLFPHQQHPVIFYLWHNCLWYQLLTSPTMMHRQQNPPNVPIIEVGKLMRLGRDISYGRSDCRSTALSRLHRVSVARWRAVFFLFSWLFIGHTAIHDTWDVWVCHIDIWRKHAYYVY